MEPLILSILLIVLIVLFIVERIPAEVAALLVVFTMVILNELNIGLRFLTPEEAVAGIANEAVITVAAMFIISAALLKSGVVAYIGDHIIALSGGNPNKVLFFSMVVVAIFSAFINNTPVVVLFVPLIMRVCFKYDLSPSKYLIPISYASILGGTTTLIGTSTNILVSGIASDLALQHPQYGLHALSMFEFAPVGIVMAVGGIIMIYLMAQRFLPERKTVTSTLANVEHKSFMTELEIQVNSVCIGQTVRKAFLNSYEGLQILEVIRGESVLYPPVDEVVLQRGDILLTKGTANDILRVQRDETAVIASELGLDSVRLTERNITMAEIVLLPGSRYVGSRIEEAQFKRRYDVNVIAILRRGRHMHIQEQIRKVKLATGDTLLIQGGEDAIARLRQAENVVLLEGIGETLVNTRKAPIALAVLFGVIVGATLNLLPIMVLAVLGALIVIITDCVPLKGAYKSVDGSVLLLIAATISLGTALENTGTAQIYGDFLVSIAMPFGPIAVLAAIFLLTAFLTEFISNTATAVLMSHIGVAAAVGLGYGPMPFLVAVLFGASACYATPIGYQTNLFVYGPGGYKFKDYSILGLPLNLLVMAIAVVLIPIFWPFTHLN